MSLGDDDKTVDTWEDIDTTNNESVATVFERTKLEIKSPQKDNTNNVRISFDDGHTPYQVQFSTILKRDKSSRLQPSLNLSETLSPQNEALSLEEKKKIYKEARQRIFKETE